MTVNFKQERIAIFIRNLAGGGAEKMMLSLANYWANEGHTIDLVLATAVGAYISDVSPQVNLIDLQCPQSKLPPALPKLVQYMKRYRPSAMLSALHYACEVAILAKYLSGVSTRIVVSERNTLSREAHTRPELSARLSPIAAQLLYPFADEIVAISNGVADDLSRTIALPRNRIRTIYNPASSKRILEMSKEKISHPWFEDSNIPVIVAVGRLAQQKDYPTLMRAVAQVNLSRPLRLVVLGKGHLKHELLNLAEKLRISDIVDFLGFASNPYAYIGRAKMLVLSSAWEGFGNVLVEALTVGTPVISTDCPSGPREILDGGKYGFLVPIGDFEALALAIQKVIDGARKEVSTEWIQQNFSLEAVAREYRQALRF